MSVEQTTLTQPRSAPEMDELSIGEPTFAVDLPTAPQATKPTVSLVLPAFNEAAVVRENLAVLYQYMADLSHKWDYELVVVNDGSKDDTSTLAKAFAADHRNVTVVDHPTNFGLGQALKSAFNQCRGDIIVVMDMDLSYTPDHIERMVDRLLGTRAKIVIASPYLDGGVVENVPPLRRYLSVGANKFLSFAAHGRIKTLTGMVRAYDAKFLRSLDFYSMGMEVNSEILYKALVLRARIVEIPARLRWNTPQTPPAGQPVRRSSMRITKYVMTLLVSGYLYRPIMFFVGPALVALAIAAVCGIIVLIESIRGGGILNAFHAAPGEFILGFLCLMAAMQLLACGLVALQNKCYFEQMFHLGTTNYRASKEGKR